MATQVACSTLHAVDRLSWNKHIAACIIVSSPPGDQKQRGGGPQEQPQGLKFPTPRCRVVVGGVWILHIQPRMLGTCDRRGLSKSLGLKVEANGSSN